MIPVTKLAAALAAWRTQGPAPFTFQSEVTGGLTITAVAERAETVGGLFQELKVTGGVADVTAAELTERAVSAAQRITGLLEPLKVYEVDAGQGLAVLRSMTPATDGDLIRYYELLLRGKSAAELRRYEV